MKLNKINIFLFAASLLWSACGANLEPDVTVDESLLKVAKQFDFDYVGTMGKAKAGDEAALKLFVAFHRFADELEGIHHGVACLEMIPFVKDGNFASACTALKPGLRKAVYERLLAAQARTKKEELKKPLNDWASATVNILTAKSFQETQADTAATKLQMGRISLDSLAKAKGITLEPSQKPK